MGRCRTMTWVVGAVILLGGLPAAAREWTDRSGTYRIEADLVSVREGKAYLERGDGKVITVPLERLSVLDLRHMASLPECRAYFESLPAAQRESLLWPKDAAGSPAAGAALPATPSSPPAAALPTSPAPAGSVSASPAPAAPAGTPAAMAAICPDAEPDEVGEVGRIAGLRMGAKALAFSPDGRFLVAGTFHDGLVVFDLVQMRQVDAFELDFSHGQAICLAFTPDGKKLLVGCSSGRIGIWNVSARGGLRAAGELSQHHGGVNTVTVSRDGDCVLSGGNDRSVRCWTLDGGRERFVVDGFTMPVKATFITRSGKQALAYDGSLLVLIDMTLGKAIQTMATRNVNVATAIAPDGSCLMMAGHFELQSWSIKTGQGRLVGRIEGSAPDQIEFLPNSRRFLARDSDKVSLWDASSSQKIQEFTATGSYKHLEVIAVSPDNRHFAAVTSMGDQGLRIFQMPPEVAQPAGQKPATLK